jgi:hypothetical protein
LLRRSGIYFLCFARFCYDPRLSKTKPLCGIC